MVSRKKHIKTFFRDRFPMNTHDKVGLGLIVKGAAANLFTDIKFEGEVITVVPSEIYLRKPPVWSSW